MNGDGYDELYLSYETPAWDSEDVYAVIIPGGLTGEVTNISFVTQNSPLLSMMVAPTIGNATGGDFNGDGIGDLAMNHGSSCRVYFGPLPKVWEPLIDEDLPFFEVTAPGDGRTGGAVANPGDLDGDGTDELMCAFAFQDQPFEVHMMDSTPVGSFSLDERSIWKLQTEVELHGSLGASHHLLMEDGTGDGVNDLFLVAPSGPPEGAGQVIMVDGTRF